MDEITVEREALAAVTDRKAPAGVFDHAAVGSPLRVDPLDRLWIGHLPFVVGRAPTGHGWEMRLASDYLDARGDRAVLGTMAFRGSRRTAVDAEVVDTWDLRVLGIRRAHPRCAVESRDGGRVSTARRCRAAVHRYRRGER